jgi:hypothetical protein
VPKITEMMGVRSDDAHPVELWRDQQSGRLVVRAYNDAGYSYTEIDLWDLIHWLQSGPRPDMVTLNDEVCGAVRGHLSGG